MATSKEGPLDERLWRSQEDVQRIGGIHTNTGTMCLHDFEFLYTDLPLVLHYFALSPFFDSTSNNAALTAQATHNASMAHVIETREAFEGALRTMQGLEFVVSQDPSDNGHRLDHSGVWVIRKQIRRKRQGAEDEILPISSYFVVGENIYTAPSVGSIVKNRMVCASMKYPGGAVANTMKALYRHVCDQTTLNRICIADLHTLSWLYVPSTSPQKYQFYNQYTSEQH